MKRNLFAFYKYRRFLIGISACFSITTLLIFFQISLGEAGFYSYKDENGKTHYTDDLSKIPLEYRESDKKLKKHKEAPKDTSTISVPSGNTPAPIINFGTPGRIASGSEIQIPLKAQGNSYYLDAVLNGGVRAKLLLDTGASKIFLSKDVATKLGYNFANVNSKQTSSTANGDTTVAAIALQTVEVGTAKSYIVEAAFNEKYDDDDGLLGMSFLNDYRFEINRDKKLLILKPLTEGEMEWGGKPGSWWKKRFDYYDENIRDYGRAAKAWRRRGKTHAAEYKYMKDYFVDLKYRLENYARVSGLPDRFK
ncbi:MAG: TIGR02281 family clan AA aspartic protease [Nitrospinota bacterium]